MSSNLPKTGGSYRVLHCVRLGAPEDVLEFADRPRGPVPPGHVRVRVRAAGVNFPDLLMLAGEYQHKPPLPFIPGFEAAGDILEAAPDVAAWQPGMAVLVHCRTGAFAEELVAPVSALLPKPAHYSYEQAAAFPVAANTAWAGLVARGDLRRGERLLVLGAGGGTGMAAVALGAQLGARVIAVASSAAKRQAARQAGAEITLDSGNPDWPRELLALTADHGSDVVFDPVGGAAFHAAWKTVAPNGRYLVIGFASGERPSLPANKLLLRGAALIGVRAGEQLRRQPALEPLMRHNLSNWLVSGQGRPLVSEIHPFNRAARAISRLGQRQAVGKLVLRIA